MRKLIDTCGWIEWLTNGSLANNYERYFMHMDDIIVPTLIQYELYKWVCREKNMSTALEIIGMTESATIIPLDTNLALYAADISKKYKLVMTDAIIYASSQKNDAILITSDKYFINLPHVKFLEKETIAN